MILNVTKEAALWYKDEMSSAEPISYIRFFPRYGFGGHIPGFSIGISSDTPDSPFVSTDVENITFYIEANDAWYFEGKKLDVILNREIEEPEFLIGTK